MKEIQKVIICGLGAIGSLYADKISQHDNKNLRILVDEDRLRKYTQTPRKYNGKLLNINYILPNETNFKADLIIIATKYDGLNNAIKNIKNFWKTLSHWDDTLWDGFLFFTVSFTIITHSFPLPPKINKTERKRTLYADPETMIAFSLWVLWWNRKNFKKI